MLHFQRQNSTKLSKISGQGIDLFCFIIINNLSKASKNKLLELCKKVWEERKHLNVGKKLWLYV